MNHTDLTSLKLFLSVYREGNITRASQKENIAPSAISRRIGSLESRYQVVLFVRSQTGVRPTPSAHALATYVSTLVDTLDKMDQSLSDFGKGRRGQVALHCNSTSLMSFVARDLSEFADQHPDIVLSLRECASHLALQALRDGHCDIGIFNSTVAPHDLCILRTRRTKLMVVMPKGHPLADIELIHFRETFGYPFIALRESPSLSRIVDNSIFAANSPHYVQLRPSSFCGMREMVRNGFGIALMPEPSCVPYASVLDIVCRPLAEPWAISEMHICVREVDTLTPAARLVVDFLMACE